MTPKRKKSERKKEERKRERITKYKKERKKEKRQPKQYGTAIPLPCIGVSVMVSKVSRAAAPKGMQSCTTHGFYVTLILFLKNFQGPGLRGEIDS